MASDGGKKGESLGAGSPVSNLRRWLERSNYSSIGHPFLPYGAYPETIADNLRVRRKGIYKQPVAAARIGSGTDSVEGARSPSSGGTVLLKHLRAVTSQDSKHFFSGALAIQQHTWCSG